MKSVKRAVALILSLSAISSSISLAASADDIAPVVCITENAGDASGDGKVNAKDVTLMLRYAAGHDVVFDADLADVNRDEKVNSKDVSVLLKFLAGYNNVRPGHADVLTATVEPSCTAAGKGIIECSICKSREEVAIPAKGHHYDNFVCTDCKAVSPDAYVTDYLVGFIKKSGEIKDARCTVTYPIDNRSSFYMAYDPKQTGTVYAGIVTTDGNTVGTMEMKFVSMKGTARRIPEAYFEGRILTSDPKRPGVIVQEIIFNSLRDVKLDMMNKTVDFLICAKNGYEIYDRAEMQPYYDLAYEAIVSILHDIEAVCLDGSPFSLDFLGYSIPEWRK